jgi:hypothetical protein
MRNEIFLTDEQIEAAFDDIGYATDIDSIAFTREALDHFRAARGEWAECGRITDDTDNVFAVAKAQVKKGEPRRNVVVIDFGAVRAVSHI